MNVAVQKLEKLGYIRKEQDEKDQRMTRIHLTERGEKILGNMHEILRSTENTLLKEYEHRRENTVQKTAFTDE